MVKGVTGLGGAQTGRLAELVVGDDEIVLAPGALSPLAAVRATLMCLRTSASQEGAAEVMGVSRPTVSRTISVVTRVIARACLPATAEEIPPPRGPVRHRWDPLGVLEAEGPAPPAVGQAQARWHEPAGTGQPHRSPGVGLRASAGKRPRLHRDSRAITASGVLEGVAPSCCVAGKGCIGAGVTAPYKKSPNGEPAEAQKQTNKALGKIRYVVEGTIAHIKARKILAHDCRQPPRTFKKTITATPAIYTYANP